MRATRRFVLIVLVALLSVAGLAVSPDRASAATGDHGYQGPSYAGATHVPTSDKPQSKLWFAQGSWWADMFDTVSRTWHIFRLDRSTQQWIDTGVLIDDRPNTLADVLWDGTHLYVASHVVTVSSDTSATPSQPNSPARLHRFSWSADRGYTRDAGFPVDITQYSSESLTIDKDTTGTLWATWTQVSAAPGGGHTSAVHVNSTSGSDSTWGTPFVVPVTGSTVSPDDISSVVAFGRNRIGLLWSNQLDGTVYWAVHDDGAPRTSWRGSPAVRGNRQADDHLNIKAVQADTSGRVFAVVKTSLDGSSTAVPTDPQIRLLSFKPGTGAWSATTVGTLADCHTRPLLLLDEGHQTVHVLATAPTTGGCPFAGAPGTIYDKTAPMADPVFPAGRGTPVIRDIASANMNDVTSTKQSVTAASGIVVLASNKATQRYWHADLAAQAAPPVAPTASFTTSVTSGQAPLPVQFTDTSSGTPTSWAWDFGDGTTATTQNPAHTYAAPGTYTVTLAVTNAAGSSTPATATVTVTAAATGSGVVTAGASTTAAGTTAGTEVTIPRPAEVTAGAVLVAQITADGAPTMAGVPSGWTATLTKPLALGSGARVFAYHRIVGDPATEPAAATWTLSAAQRWGGGMTAFTGVDPAAPFDTPISTAVDSTYAATALTVPGVTTVTDGALLVGGLGLDNVTAGVGAPSAWTEAWESTGAQVSELAHRQTSAAGSTGALTWTLSRATAAGGWVRALRPVPAPPAASFTSSVTEGQAPLEVRFTDTSAGGPTSWSWDLGDGTTSTAQHPTHTYTAPGTYTVRLTATNPHGASAPATATVTVTAPPPSGSAGISVGGSTTAAGMVAGTGVTVPRPAGVAAGDVLVAQITANGAPSMAAVPAGWTSVLTAPVAVHSGARVFVYHHVVAGPAAEPTSWTWQLSTAQKWNAGMTAFAGVDNATPFESPASTAVQSGYTTPGLSVPGVTTSTAGAMVVGGIGLDSSATPVTPPTGWAEAWESSGAQVAELAHLALPQAGATGPATWTLGKSTASGGWLRALRPAPGPTTPPPGPAAPRASFTSSVTGGQAPLEVRFTDTSAGGPTSWSWDLGDGTTSTAQHPTHTYTAPGTYTVRLTAANAAGSSATADASITVTATTPPPARGTVTAGASATAVSTTAAADVTMPRPTGLADGDVLIAQITADNAPSMSSVPAGWTPVLAAPVSIGSGARVFVYSRMVTSPATEPASYTWRLSAAQKWGAVVGSFRGVDRTTVFDTAPVTAVDRTYTASSLTLPGVTTVTEGAMLIGGIGLDSSAAGIEPPTGWAEVGESSGAQTAELAHRTPATVGASGSATWRLPKATAVAGWLVALRPPA
ncbi:PKD domain-containing protein [Geodermatophilus sabuli]|uniref:PKD repeat-containing protein n=1 Tax=Geodermatophilus sabuli TaxID=1564158 RepID=A0A285EDH3_9ACTN|nr:PKD domain-containing protein [Geodermatophilus sabuli]MBB3083226.1 PKD repeat protein [Geodermatophilus sabuli]SNX97050.1 PKD repeat-containing protein [Geodermatophilus sabuli]